MMMDVLAPPSFPRHVFSKSLDWSFILLIFLVGFCRDSASSTMPPRLLCSLKPLSRKKASTTWEIKDLEQYQWNKSRRRVSNMFRISPCCQKKNTMETHSFGVRIFFPGTGKFSSCSSEISPTKKTAQFFLRATFHHRHWFGHRHQMRCGFSLILKF